MVKGLEAQVRRRRLPRGFLAAEEMNLPDLFVAKTCSRSLLRTQVTVSFQMNFQTRKAGYLFLWSTCELISPPLRTYLNLDVQIAAGCRVREADQLVHRQQACIGNLEGQGYASWAVRSAARGLAIPMQLVRHMCWRLGRARLRSRSWIPTWPMIKAKECRWNSIQKQCWRRRRREFYLSGMSFTILRH